MAYDCCFSITVLSRGIRVKTPFHFSLKYVVVVHIYSALPYHQIHYRRSCKYHFISDNYSVNKKIDKEQNIS